jgi:uncharacterized membrane protein YkvA (DUF1232 family)
MTFEMVLWVVVGLIVAWALLIGLLWILRPRGVPLREALRLIPDVLRLVRGLVTDRSVPLRVRLALIGLVVWLASPIDLIPEFVPVLGPLDDIVVAVIVLRYARRVLGDDEIRRRWAGTADGYALLQTVLGSAKG